MNKKIIALFCCFCSAYAVAECGKNLGCYEKQLQTNKKALNQAFEKLVQADKEKITLESFERSQILWNQFIKADCQFMNSPMAMTLGEGSQVAMYECLDSHYQQRIGQIQQMVRELEKE